MIEQNHFAVGGLLMGKHSKTGQRSLSRRSPSNLRRFAKDSKNKRQSISGPPIERRIDSASEPRRVRRGILRAKILLGVLLTLIEVAGCHMKPDDDATGVEECDAYVASLTRCTGSSNPLIAPARASLRENFNNAHGDEQKLTSLASQCRDGRRTLEEACR